MFTNTCCSCCIGRWQMTDCVRIFDRKILARFFSLFGVDASLEFNGLFFCLSLPFRIACECSKESAIVPVMKYFPVGDALYRNYNDIPCSAMYSIHSCRRWFSPLHEEEFGVGRGRNREWYVYDIVSRMNRYRFLVHETLSWRKRYQQSPIPSFLLPVVCLGGAMARISLCMKHSAKF